MLLSPITYVRKPFVVDAIEVTEENISLVAEWCGGELREAENKVYIKVPVRRPLNDKQTRAEVGNWVLNSGDGFKVYSKSAFYGSFEKPTGTVLDRLIQERKPRPFPGEPPEMAEEVTPLSRQGDGIIVQGAGQIIDLRDADQRIAYNRSVEKLDHP